MLGKPCIFYHFPNLFTGILLTVSLDVILSNAGITKLLIRLHMRRLQAGLHLCCSQTPENRFSHNEAHHDQVP